MTSRTTEPFDAVAPPCRLSGVEPAFAPGGGAGGCALAGSRRSPRRSVWCRRSSPTSARSRDDPIRASGSGPSSGCATTARAGLVNRVENVYYSLTAPSKGGPALQGAAHAVRRRRGYTGSDPADPVPPPADPSLPPAEHRAGDPSGARGRGRLARDVRQRRLAPPGADHELPPRARLPAPGRGRGLDRPHTHERDAVPGDFRARRDDAPRAGRRRSR